MIDQITIDRIVEAARIEDVVGEFVSLKKRGINLVGLCPFHTDKTPSFYVSPSKNICKCFACGEGGSSVHFIMKHEQLSYYEALRFLAKKYNIEIQEKELTDEQKNAYNERESLFILNDYARNYFVNTLNNHLEGKTIGLSYFKERGFRDDIVKKFQLGYSLEQKDALTQDAQKNGFRKDYLVKTGLTIEGENYLVDRFRGRVMFPVHTLSGKVVAFGGRILKKAENTGKYVNSPESDIYHKSDQLYGIYFAKQAISKLDCCYLVEGYTDVISMHQAGLENVVASSGTALTHGQIKLIHRFTTNITVLYDGDAAGIKAALRGIDLLLEEGMNVKVVLLPDGEDPDSFARKQNAESLRRYIKENEVDFIRFKTQLLLDEAGNDPIKKASLITDIVNSISVIPDGIVRSVYIHDCSSLLSIDERILINEINKKRLAYLEKEFQAKKQISTDANSLLESDNLSGGATNLTSSINIVPQVKNARENALDKYELSILYYLIRYGNLPMLSAEERSDPVADEENVTVLEYVRFDLERDGLWFQNPLYRDILDEAVSKMDDSSFVPSRYFLAHPNQDISVLSARLLQDRYELGKIHIKQYGENVKREDTPLAEENQLKTSVPLALLELKEAYISMKLKELKNQINQCWKSGDSEAESATLAEYQELRKIRDILAKALLEKVVLRF